MRPAVLACAALAFNVALAVQMALPVAAASTLFVSETFLGASLVNSGWSSPLGPSGGGPNVVCLTASTATGQTPVPGCSSSYTDPVGSGALRLTAATGSQEGGVVYESIPSSTGIDITFNSYQYGSSSKADGIAFFLAAVNPANPLPVTNIGQPGGDLGYSSSGGLPGMVDGYLGLGLDVYGNYTNNTFEGSGCTSPGAWLTSSLQAEQVTVHGPGNGTVGYCILTSTAATDGGNPVALQGSTTAPTSAASQESERAAAKVPVEVVINPGSSPVTTPSGLTVSAGDYEIAFTPIGSTQQTLSGPMPTTLNGEIPGGLYPASWVNPTTGLPYQFDFGFVGSTGGSTDIHEVNNVVATSNGPTPVLSTALSTSPASVQNGQTLTYTANVTVSASGSAETDPIYVADTFPSGETPTATGLGGTNWSCSITGQTVNCTYAAGTYAPGTALSPLAMPVVIGSPGGTNFTDTYFASSYDSYGSNSTATITVAASPQTVSFTSTAPTGATVGGATYSVFASATSGLTPTIIVDSSSSSICSITGSTVKFTAVGTCTLDANQAGNAAYLPASQVQQSFSVGIGSQTITNTNPATAGSVGGTFTPSATASSGLPVTITVDSSSSAVCYITGGVVYYLAAGTCLLDYNQPGNANYLPASQIQDSITVSAASGTQSDTTTLAVDTNPITYGNEQVETLTATVTRTSGTGRPAGSVTVTQGATTVCVITLTTNVGTTAKSGTCTLNAGVLNASGTPYTLTASYGGNASFKPSSGTGSLTVNPAALQITASSSSMTYGGVVPGVSASYTGFVNGDTAGSLTTAPSCSAAGGSSPAAGTYTTTCSGAVDGNYSITYVNGTLTVGKAALTVRGPNVSIVFGGSVPSLSASYSGFVDGDAVTSLAAQAVCTTSAVVGSPVSGSPYAVVCSGAADPNYNFIYSQGSIVIAKAATSVAVTTTEISVHYGTAIVLSFTGVPPTATGDLSVYQGSALLCTVHLPTMSCSIPGVFDPGNYPVTVTYGGDGNYTGSSSSAAFAVTPAPTVVTLSESSPVISVGSSVTLVANVAPNTGGGTITFYSGGVAIPGCVDVPVNPSTGSATCTTAYPQPGSEVLSAEFSGSTDYQGSSSVSGSSTTLAVVAQGKVPVPSTGIEGSMVLLLEQGLVLIIVGSLFFIAVLQKRRNSQKQG